MATKRTADDILFDRIEKWAKANPGLTPMEAVAMVQVSVLLEIAGQLRNIAEALEDRGEGV